MAAEKYLPAEWGDDERMRVLFGPMPPSHDSVAYSARQTFWATTVHQWCRTTLSPIFSVQECEAAMRRGTQTPRCLPDILHHMYRQGEIVPLCDLIREFRSGNNESWGSWGMRLFVTTPAHLTWGWMKRALGWGGLSQGPLVDTWVLKEMCNKLLNAVHLHATTSLAAVPTLFTYPQLYSLFGVEVAGGSANTLQLLVDELSRHGHVRVVKHRGNCFVKFPLPGDSTVPDITQVELSERELTQAQYEVEGTVNKMTEEVEQLRQRAKKALQTGARSEALFLLRRKKHLNKSMDTQLGALGNITSCLQQLQDSRLNKQVLGAFRTGVEALRVSLGGDFSVEGASSTIDQLNQVLEECDEVSSMVAGRVQDQDDEEDLEAELNDLMQTEAQHTRGLKLPDVPQTNPMASFSSLPQSAEAHHNWITEHL